MKLILLDALFGVPDCDQTIPGKTASCSCGNSSFAVFQIIGQDHWHIECLNCSSSYCSFGRCSEAMRRR